MSTWRLKATSFDGILAGAFHYMGTLHGPKRQEIEVEAVLTEEWAKALSTDDFTYRPGVECERFISKADMEAAAVEQWRALAEPGDVLIAYWTERVIASMGEAHV